jgi:hypothetical protein
MRDGLHGGLVALFIVCVCSAAVIAQRDSKPTGSATSVVRTPILISPKHRDTVPRAGVDPPCKSGSGCSVVNVEGQIPPGLTPFLAVAPLLASPRIWIQPNVIAVRRDGSFDGIVYLGSERIGIGERFTIYVLGCKSSARFRPEEIIENLPSDCVSSDPVTVTRAK